jgi:hypothetical protein
MERLLEGRKETDAGPMPGVRCPSCGAAVAAGVAKNSARICLICFAQILDSELHLLRDNQTAHSKSKSHFQVLSRLMAASKISVRRVRKA